jgi:two-component system nitrogen regulation sensor histidine kinase NtrY
MVDEFSAFARMPAPNFSSVDFKVLISNILFAQRVSFPEIKFDISIKKTKSSKIICDERLITQALTNIYKNGVESIIRRFDQIGAGNSEGKISTFVNYSEEYITISIFDNGTGWPVQDKDRLLEPYVTTRESGTGLGLAIVMRIAEDHGGKLKLNDRDDNKLGALVEISFRKNAAENYIKTTI